MIEFDKPTNLDGKVLIEELIAVGIEIGFDKYQERLKPVMDGEGKFYLPINESDRLVAQQVLDKH